MNLLNDFRIQSMLVLVLVLACPLDLPTAEGQFAPSRQELINGSVPPGTLARLQLLRDPELSRYIQPVQVEVPGDATIAFWHEDAFENAETSVGIAGLTVGPVYRVKISNIKGHPGLDVYPSIEMLDRLYPPKDLALEHPVNIVIHYNDLLQITRGKMVTKVIYLEDPMTALPYRQQESHQSTFDVGFREDPFQVARRLGRPMAIVRLGTRSPLPGDETGDFGFSNPPIQFYQEQQPTPAAVDDVSSSDSASVESVQQVTYAEPRSNKAVYEWQMKLNARPPAQAMPECPSCPPALLGVANCLPTKPIRMPDEYICDGCDRIPQVRVDENWKVSGLGIEDTIGHFDTLQGETIVIPSNRVCVYSPRFASVRKIFNFGHSNSSIALASFKEKKNLEQTSGRDWSSTSLQQLRLQSNKSSYRANAFKDHTRGVEAGNIVHLIGSYATLKPFNNLQLVKFGRYENTESARLNLGMQSALAWDVDVASQMTVKNAQPVIVDDIATIREVVAVESESHPNLRLCKIASRLSAKSGEEVEFTIRFDNIGDQRIGNVTIIDNLSPRLEFIAESASCTLDATLITTINEAGSLAVSWEITEPIEKATGGVIQFKCRVR
ncbi:MAG: DUF11 domain-containing protein [Mariniblastus sp.]|nr:DUF11 domain-containing protein [Mariniblastus sp.]